MCITVFVWQAHPVYPLVLLSNRYEFLDRPTQALTWWEGGQILGGRDVTAGGTWLASSRDGRVALITNARQLNPMSVAKSRGDLPIRFLQSNKKPMEFAEEVAKEADQYNGFNLLIADIMSNNMVYVTNRLNEDKCNMTTVEPGVHVLSNASLDTPWPKCSSVLTNMLFSIHLIVGEVVFYEKHLENDLWKEQTESYVIEKKEQ
ncbi:uncharacterized protein LOC143581049 [Bidens hawaiensis]|uniref:uncharacterized protein LOC143581049 n=1 Tax=Bidens hawaiensis TaxID=980011 RepID=UPI00404A1FA3